MTAAKGKKFYISKLNIVAKVILIQKYEIAPPTTLTLETLYEGYYCYLIYYIPMKNNTPQIQHNLSIDHCSAYLLAAVTLGGHFVLHCGQVEWGQWKGMWPGLAMVAMRM